MIYPADTEDHPEQLIDLALTGTLAESQWRTLRAHLAVCRPCAAQMRVAGSLSEDASRNVALLQMRDRATVSRVLEQWEQTQRPRRPPLVPRWALPAAASLALSGAAAAMAGSWWSNRQPQPVPAVGGAQVPERGAISLLLPPSAAAGTAPVDSAPAPVDSALPALPAPATIRALAPKPPEPATASALFARAAELRLKGQRQAAITTFKHLQALYPDSRESLTSHLLLGRLWLDGQRPDLAAPEFARYFKSGGAATEEALLGHATALRRMGKLAEEAADWQRLLNKYPKSLYAAEARKRLNELQHPLPSEASQNSPRP